MAQTRNSLVDNINRRKRAGKSRPKKQSTVAKAAYRDLQQGWPDHKKQRGKKASSKKRTTSKTAARRPKSTRKATTR